MDSLTFEQLQEIIVCALNRMDRRLTGHGERIAYGVMRLLEGDPRCSPEETAKIIWTALLHDIGNFQNPDIKDLLRKEADTDFSHARYGYLFLRYLGPFPEYAGIVYYHHSGKKEIETSFMSEIAQWIAKCILVLDAVDLYRIVNSSLSKEKLELFLDHLDRERYDEKAVQAVRALVHNGQQYALSQEEVHQTLIDRLSCLPVGFEEQEALLQILISSIDFRSHYTALHCSIMVRISDMLALLCGLDEQSRRVVHVGAILHDIGKIAIPTHILESLDRLEGEDWEIMRSHVIISGEILEGVVDDEILQIAVRHHETLDGLGYPRGLTATDLTLPQRIVAVADIFSALCEERSYKAAFSQDEVISILEDMCRRGKLCTQVVGTLMDNKDAIYAEALRAGKETRTIYQYIWKEYAGQ